MPKSVLAFNVYADFQRCGAGGTVLGLLMDVRQFWEYENREALLQQQPQQAEAQELQQDA